jgi:hypothetical protein
MSWRGFFPPVAVSRRRRFIRSPILRPKGCDFIMVAGLDDGENRARSVEIVVNAWRAGAPLAVHPAPNLNVERKALGRTRPSLNTVHLVTFSWYPVSGRRAPPQGGFGHGDYRHRVDNTDVSGL